MIAKPRNSYLNARIARKFPFRRSCLSRNSQWYFKISYMNQLQIIKLCINKIAKVFRNLFSKVAARKRPHARGGHQNFSRARGPKIEISRGRGGQKSKFLAGAGQKIKISQMPTVRGFFNTELNLVIWQSYFQFLTTNKFDFHKEKKNWVKKFFVLGGVKAKIFYNNR